MTAIYSGATSTMINAIDSESTMRLGKGTSGIIDDGDLDVSPVTLSSAWSRVARLLLLVSLAVCGSIGNVFMISAVVVEDQLNKRGTLAILLFVVASKNEPRKTRRERSRATTAPL